MGAVSTAEGAPVSRSLPRPKQLRRVLQRTEAVRKRLDSLLDRENRVGCGVRGTNLAKIGAFLAEAGSFIGMVGSTFTGHPYLACALGGASGALAQGQECLRGVGEKKTEALSDLRSMKEVAEMIRVHTLELLSMTREDNRSEQEKEDTLNRNVRKAAGQLLQRKLSRRIRPSAGVVEQFALRGKRLSPPPDEPVTTQPRSLTFLEPAISMPKLVGPSLREVRSYTSILSETRPPRSPSTASFHSEVDRSRGPTFTHIKSEHFRVEDLTRSPSLGVISAPTLGLDDLTCHISGSGEVMILSRREKIIKDITRESRSPSWRGDSPLPCDASRQISSSTCRSDRESSPPDPSLYSGSGDSSPTSRGPLPAQESQ